MLQLPFQTSAALESPILSLSLCPIFEAINVEPPLFPPRMLQKMTSLSGISVLFLFIILSCNADVSTYHNGNGSSPYLPQSPKSATELIAALDGTVSLVDSASGKVIWSFSTGLPIHHSFQAPMNDSNKAASGLIEVGDDWELIIHDTDMGKTKLSQSLVEYVLSTPIESKNKAIIHGSKFSTAFGVDAKTGRLVWRSVKVLWTLEVAEFKASLSCQRNGNTTSRASFDSKGESGGAMAVSVRARSGRATTAAATNEGCMLWPGVSMFYQSPFCF